MQATDASHDHFEHLYASSEDPYGVHDRWYEARKRAVLLASLSRPVYRQAYEPGCGAGNGCCDPACGASTVAPTPDASAKLQGKAVVAVAVAK